MTEDQEREALQMAYSKMASHFKDIKISGEIRKEYAALSQIGRAAIRAAELAVDGSCLKASKIRETLIGDLAIEFIRATVVKQQPLPQIMMMPQQQGNVIPGAPFGLPGNLS